MKRLILLLIGFSILQACEQANSEQLRTTSGNAALLRVAATEENKETNARLERERQLLLKELKQDARRGKNMRLRHFGQYMQKRWPYYAAKGDFSFQDEAIDIKITQQEMMIRNSEGGLRYRPNEIPERF